MVSDIGFLLILAFIFFWVILAFAGVLVHFKDHKGILKSLYRNFSRRDHSAT